MLELRKVRSAKCDDSDRGNPMQIPFVTESEGDLFVLRVLAIFGAG